MKLGWQQAWLLTSPRSPGSPFRISWPTRSSARNEVFTWSWRKRMTARSRVSNSGCVWRMRGAGGAHGTTKLEFLFQLGRDAAEEVAQEMVRR